MSRGGPWIVAVPTPMGGAFVGGELGGPMVLTSEYPDAQKFEVLKVAKTRADGFSGAQVYTVQGYEEGSGPVYRVPV